MAKEELDLLDKTEDLLERKSGFLIRNHNIEYYGLCRKCRPDGASILTEKNSANLRLGEPPLDSKRANPR